VVGLRWCSTFPLATSDYLAVVGGSPTMRTTGLQNAVAS
jgi:hypothetical protein